MRYFDRAALFVEACLKYGAFEVNEDTDILCRDVCAKRRKGDVREIYRCIIVRKGHVGSQQTQRRKGRENNQDGLLRCRLVRGEARSAQLKDLCSPVCA